MIKLHEEPVFEPGILPGLGSYSELAIMEHISHALLTEMIFHLLQSIPSERLLRFPRNPGESEYHTMEIIIEWLQVSVSECNRQTPQTKQSNLYLTGTWFRATERLV